MAQKGESTTLVTLDQAKKLKGNSNLAKLYAEQQKQRTKSLKK